MRMLYEGGRMVRNICISCGTMILKSAVNDPYLCRDCEMILQGTEREKNQIQMDNY